MLKAELHTHIHADPKDGHFVTYSAQELIDEAAQKNFDVLGISCHDYLYRDQAAEEYARQKGILLLSGVERTIEGKHVLLYNLT